MANTKKRHRMTRTKVTYCCFTSPLLYGWHAKIMHITFDPLGASLKRCLSLFLWHRLHPTSKHVIFVIGDGLYLWPVTFIIADGLHLWPVTYKVSIGDGLWQVVTGMIKVRHLCGNIGGVQHQDASLLWLFIIFEHAILKNSNCLRLKMVYTKVVGLNQINNFVVENFFRWGCFGIQIHGFNFEFQIFKCPQMEKKVYIKVVGCDQICNFVVEKIFIWDRYSCEMGYIWHLKVMIKEKYLIVGHMWWCSPVVREGTREAKVVGSNPGNGGKIARAHIRDLRLDTRARWKKKIFFNFYWN